MDPCGPRAVWGRTRVSLGTRSPLRALGKPPRHGPPLALTFQAIAIHWKGHLPSRGNLIVPLYCNADVPVRADQRTILDCARWPISDVAAVYANKTPMATHDFRSSRTISPASTDYHWLCPLNGRLLLTQAEYHRLASGSAYVIMYTQADSQPYGTIRGAVVTSHQPSCVGGSVFEYTDEWWKVWRCPGSGE